MRKQFIVAILSGFVGLTAKAAFVCDYNYTAEGQDIQSTLQIEQMGGKDLLTMKARSGELIAAFQVSGVQRTRIGSVVNFFMTADGLKIEGELLLPRILPGPGQIVWGQDGSESVSCRNLK